MRALALVFIAACGSSDPAPPTTPTAPKPAVAPAVIASACGPLVPVAACRAPDVHVCTTPEASAWRYALVGAPFEATENVAMADVVTAWRAGAIAASAETSTVLAPLLGARGTSATTPAWSIVPAHELTPSGIVITVDGKHPLADPDEPLAIGLCGTAANIDPAKLTTLVMSGTTALTGRTAERIDSAGIADTIRFIAPFFTSANLVHISNEVSFVKDCHPSTGQQDHLKFCARDRYIDLLAALHTTIIELTGSHLIDYGTRALGRTIDMYQKRGWVWFGGGRTQLEATEPRIVEDHGNKLAFLGCNHVNWWIRAISPGLGGANCDYPRMAWQIQDLRRRGITPIVSVQHRELVTHRPDSDLVADLRGLAEAGAAFVQGSQAHVAHPWDVHFGAFVHYGPGNILFAQHPEYQREAAVDKLYILDGTLRTVGHIFVRSEHGQPRLLRPDERARFLGQMAVAEVSIALPNPTAIPPLPAPPRVRPDSLVVHGRSQKISIVAPAALDAAQKYPLVVELATNDPPANDGAFVVVRSGKAIATGEEIAGYMRAKYPIDPAHVSVGDDPNPITKPLHVKRFKMRTRPP